MIVRPSTLPNTAYGDCLPTGEFVTSDLATASIVTHAGMFVNPNGVDFMMHNRIINTGGKVCIASKGHSDGLTYALRAGVWEVDDRLSHGTQGHMWNPETGALAVIEPVANQESQGLRFYDPSLPAGMANQDAYARTLGFVTGSPTYNAGTSLAKRLGVRGVWEWTHTDGITAGQGDGGAVIEFEDEDYLLLEGDCRFIQFKMLGHRCAFAITRFAERDTAFVWMERADIRTLPKYRPTVVSPPAPPSHPPEITMELPNLMQTCVRVRAKYPSMVNHDQAAAIINEVAWTHRGDGIGLLKKTGGNNCSQPRTGTPVSVDWLLHRPSGKGGDFFGDGPGIDETTGQRVPGAMKPSQPAGESADFSRFVEPIEPMDGSGPGTPPSGNTHRYVGGGNDTGTCDDCGAPRVSDVHRVPEGKVQRHTPWLGEDNKGDCDLCFEPVDAEIHKAAAPQPVPVPVPTPEPVPPNEYHPFVGSVNAIFCGECGQRRTAPIHQKPAPPVTPPASQFDDARIVAVLNQLLESNKRIEGLLDKQRTTVSSGLKDITAMLSKFNLGGFFGGKK